MTIRSRVRLRKQSSRRPGPASLDSRRRPIAVRRTADRRIVRPRAASENFVASRPSCQVGAAVCRGVNIGRGRVVKAIFPDVAVHIVQAKPVGRKCTGRRRRGPEYASGTLVISPKFIGHIAICRGGDALPITLAAYGPALTAIIRQIGGDRGANIERASRSRATGVLPLCFGGQTNASSPVNSARRRQNSSAWFQVMVSTGRLSPLKKDGDRSSP